MMRSLYSAISGLKNHQTYMDVIGNNIANVNTTGFKKSTVTFATALSQSMKGASAPSPNQGGANPMLIGLGANVGSINQIMTQGSEETTGNPTDMMIQNSGYFVLNNHGQQVYTRAGGFSQDSSGNLVDPATGATVQGYSWGADDSTIPDFGQLGNIKFKLGDTLPGENFYPIPESASTQNSGTQITAVNANHVYNLGVTGAENLTIDGLTRVTSNPSSGQFSYNPSTGFITFGSDVAPSASSPLTVHYEDPSDTTTGTSNSPAIIDATNTGTIIVAYPPNPGAVVYNNGTQPYKYTTNDPPGDGQYSIKSLNNGTYQITLGANDAGIPAYTNDTGSLVAAVAPAATAATTSISYDFTNTAHTLTSFSIDQNGIITGVYSNGSDSVTHKIAQIAIASFANDSGLQNVGGNFYVTSNNSGVASIGAAGENGRGSVVSGALEMSNVDLSQEMTNMITAQRGFQANSRVITVSDTLLQELIDLKRQ